MTDARIVPDPNNPHDPTEVCVSPSGVAVWALIGYWKGLGCGPARVRCAYGISEEEMDAALYYYLGGHRAEIDVRLSQNA